MAADREQVLTALVARLQTMTFAAPINGQTGWDGTVSRRLVLWPEVPPAQQPAAFLIERGEGYAQRGSGLPVRRLMPQLVCYCRSDGSHTVGDTYLNLIMRALEAALAPDDPSRGVCTLGGLVYWARIDGEPHKNPGDEDNQALLMVPLLIELP